MSNLVVSRPDASEYAPYYDMYISLVKEGDIIRTLSDQLGSALTLLNGISEEKASYRYAPDKWSIKQIVGHMTDAERIMSYRALRIARNDKTPIEGFEQDDYVKYASFDDCALADLVEEFKLLRQANLLLYRQLKEEAWYRMGTANDVEVSVRAIVYVIAGHVTHHMEILKSQYL